MTKRTTKPTIPKERRNWKPLFLAALAKSLNVTKAAKIAKANRQRVYEVRATDPEFAKQWDDAIAQAVDLAEGELFRRAAIGVKKPVTVAGKREIIIETSDTLLQFLLKAHRPDRYRETTRNLNFDLTRLTTDQLERLAKGEDVYSVLVTPGSG